MRQGGACGHRAQTERCRSVAFGTADIAAYQSQPKVDCGFRCGTQRKAAAELEIARKDHAWFVAALRDFAKVWVNMSPDNQGRFLRALIDKVVVDEDKGTCRVELIDFGAASGTKEAA